MAGRTIHFVSLGCPKNRVDTEIMLGVSDHAGFRAVERAEDAEIIVVNTCGFIDAAKEESIRTILDLAEHKRTGRCDRLVVAGCLSQRYSDQLAADMPEIDHLLGSSDMLSLERVLDGDAERMLVGNPAEHLTRASDPRRLSQAPHSAYLKIAEGCNRTCSFCAIPAIRGPQRSRPMADVVAEAEQLVSLGVVELNLVSQDTIAWGRDLPDRPRLATLARSVADVPGVRWVRLHYLYPETLDSALLEVLAEHPRVLPYVDMPLQHVSDRVLRRMRRGHGGARPRRLIESLRRRVPAVVIRTALIAGHPGEGDDDFDELCDFLRWAELDHVGVFVYSHEEGTRAGTMTDRAPRKTARARQRKLLSIQRAISRRKLRSRIGYELDVIVEGVSSESDLLLEGRWWGQAPEVDGKVVLANGSARPGEIRRALVTDASHYDLVADLLSPDGARDAPPAHQRRRPVRLRTL